MQTLENLYKLKPDNSGFKSSLIIWYNNLIKKTYDEVNEVDVLKMNRQNILIELALKRAIEILKENLFIGEFFDGEVFNMVSNSNLDTLNLEYIKYLIDIVKNARNSFDNFDWLDEDERSKFISSLNNLEIKLNNYVID